jgi:hypothetical protein
MVRDVFDGRVAVVAADGLAGFATVLLRNAMRCVVRVRIVAAAEVG